MSLLRHLLTKQQLLQLSILIAAALLTLSTGRMPDFYDDLIRKYREFQVAFTPVKLTIITNQPAYAPGDTVFFSAWYTYEDFTPVKGSHLVRMDLLNNQGLRIKSIRFRVTDGTGQNQLVLPSDIPAGLPLLVAYTDWMKNFSDRWFFKRMISVVTATEDVKLNVENVPVSFHPEGGYFTADIPNHIVVIGPARTRISIQDSQQNQLTDVLLDSTGLGSITIIPKAGERYQGIVNGKVFALPDVQTDGIGIMASRKNPSTLLLQRPESSTYAEQQLLCIVTVKGKIIFDKRIQFGKATLVELELPLQEAGYHIVYLFNQRGQRLGERILYNNNSSGMTANIGMDDGLIRQTLTGRIEIVAGNGIQTDAQVAMTVIQQQLFPDYHPQNIFLLADLPEVLTRLEFFGLPALNSINDYLITRQWHRINWTAIMQTQPPIITYPFRSSLSISGTVKSILSGTAPTDSLTMLTYLRNNTMGYETPERKGRFEINYMSDYFGEDEAFIGFQTGNTIRDDQFTVQLDEQMQETAYSSPGILLQAPSMYGEYAATKKIIDQSYGYFAKSDIKTRSNASMEVIAFEDEYNGADYTVNLTDYVVFATMKDLIHEVVPFVQLREKNNEPVVRLMFRNSNGTRIYDPNPLYCIDGVFTRNTRFFSSLNPGELLELKLFNNPYKLTRMGLIGKNGVILVTSRKGNLGQQLLSKNHIPLVGLNPVEENKSLKVITPGIPFTTANLLWNPKLTITTATPTDFRITASDDSGTMKLLVWGLTANGLPIYALEEFQVKFKP